MAFQKTKTDEQLGYEIQKHLESLGLQTPVDKKNLSAENKDKIEKIENHMTEVFKILGLDLSDDSLIETPKRVAKMMVLDQYWGLLPENFPKNTMIKDKMKVDEMVTVGGIQVNSLCEHHALPILGKAYVSYIAEGKVIGLSKLSRVVEYFCKRPQVQERLTSQIYHTLSYMLGTEHVAVGINAVHLCMTTRGVEDAGAWTQTTKLGGAFKENNQTRQEFLSLMR
jgi:GTP cyclohydrolase I